MPKDWNSAYENEDTPWDKGYASPPLGEFLASHSVEGRILVPGCGSGHDVRALAAQGADVVGMDIAPSALVKAASFPVAGTERYVLGDFLNPTAEHIREYDWVFEHTCLCAIEPSERSAYVQALGQILKAGGHYLAVFFREVSDYTGDGPPHPISKEEIDDLFAEEFEIIESFVPQLTYPGRPIGAEEVCWMRLK